ncbi:hypothetical protein Y032_0028g1687 [Ancylostoma ceylanicum]|nr:hypothetical protein Y032_0028g1687 [Ancylostoma ceylanicum]
MAVVSSAPSRQKRAFDSFAGSFSGLDKRAFDALAAPGFDAFNKRAFDSFAGQGFDAFNKRAFDSLSGSGLTPFNKRAFDSLANNGFSGFDKRSSLTGGSSALYKLPRLSINAESSAEHGGNLTSGKGRSNGLVVPH